MEWQNYVAASIAIAAGAWAAWRIYGPLVSAFREKNEPSGGCCGCGTKDAAHGCGAQKIKKST